MNERSEQLFAEAGALLAGSRSEEALARIDAALRIDRMEPRYHYLAGICLAGLGRGEDAIASLRRALKFRPSFVEARGNLGILLERSGQLEEAAECYRRVATERRDDVNAWDRLGHCTRLLGRTKESINALRQSIALSASSAAAHNELALALLQDGDRGGAMDAFGRAVDLDAEFVPAWANLAKLLYLEFAAHPPEERAPLAPRLLEMLDRVLLLEPDHAEFRFLRDAVSGKHVDRPPDAYVSAFFDRFAPQFDEHLTGQLRYTGPEVARAALAPWLEARKAVRALDLGCGTGLSGAIVRARASHLAGVDLSAGMLERARLRGIYDVLEQREAVDYLSSCEAASFDLVLALDVFIYVGALERMLPPIARVLAPGSRLAASVETGKGDGYRLMPTGRYAHSPEYVTRLASASGLALVECREFAVREEAGRPVAALMLLFSPR